MIPWDYKSGIRHFFRAVTHRARSIRPSILLSPALSSDDRPMWKLDRLQIEKYTGNSYHPVISRSFLNSVDIMSSNR